MCEAWAEGGFRLIRSEDDEHRTGDRRLRAGGLPRRRGAAPPRTPAVFLHPSGVYGPGPAGSPGISQFFFDLRDGKVPMLLPGGMPVVVAADVGEGHALAAEKAAPGSRYILSDRYYTLTEVAQEAARQLGLRKVPPVMPLWVGKLVSVAGEAISRRTGRPPLIPRGQLHFLQWGAKPRSDRAQRELGWTPTPLDEGIARTLEAARGGP